MTLSALLNPFVGSGTAALHSFDMTARTLLEVRVRVDKFGTFSLGLGEEGERGEEGNWCVCQICGVRINL